MGLFGLGRSALKAKEAVEKKRILVIDDEKDFGRSLKLGLEKFGLYQVDAVTDGSEGLRWLGERSYDLVILDVLLPKMEGREALQRIKEVSETPVVILSAYIPPLMEQEILRQGAFACLRKPVDFEKIVWTIHKALS